MFSNHKTEIYILCGFLGSGKSTLLTRLIQYEQQQRRKIAVVMNEFGEISIDSSFIPEGLPLKELLDGCICCSLQDNLSSQIEQLIENYELDAIYIESTGAAQPLDIVDACTEPNIACKIEIQAVITVVDAKQWDNSGSLKVEIRDLLDAQVKSADVIVLNKIDTLPDPSKIECLKENILKINPGARIMTAVRTNIDLRAISALKGMKREPGISEKLHVHHRLHLHSFTFSPQKPLNRQAFEKWLYRFPGQLYRAKGYILLDEEKGLFLFQYSYEQTIFTRFLVDMNYEPVLVFIGHELDAETMKSELHALQTSFKEPSDGNIQSTV